MSEEDIAVELSKCKNSPYYFATTYLKIYDKDGNEHLFTTRLSENEFNDLFYNYVL